MPSRSIRAVASGKISSFTAEREPIVSLRRIFFIPSPVIGHLGRSRVLALGDKAAVNVGVQASVELVFFSLDKFPEGELLSPREVLVLISCGSSTPCFTAAAPACIPRGAQGFPFLHVLASTCSF